MTRTGIALAALTITVLFAAPTSAQAPFFGGGTGIFDPEIDVIESGMLLDAQATVSADRKYVTMTMRPQNTQLLSIQEFAFQTGGALGGVVGGGAVGAGAGFGAAANGDAGGDRQGRRGDHRGAAAVPNKSSAHPNRGKPYPTPQAMAERGGVPLLEKPGMTLVGRVRAASVK